MDPYYKKTIPYKLSGMSFNFDVGNTLFSTFSVDHGTDVLLRYLSPGSEPESILDIGCGTGVLGIVLGKKYPNARVTCVDKDLLAIRYTQINAEKNNVKNLEALGSVATEAVSDRVFDLIVSNVPAKIGDSAIEKEFILKPLELLRPEGELWIVVVTGLNRIIPKIGRRHTLKMKEVKKRHGHSVYRIKK